jgi:hypothetical protein
MITTSTSVTIQKVIRMGAVTTYSTGTVSLFMKHDNLQKRFTASTVTNATATSTGLITFTSVPLWGDGGYSFYITAEGNADLDTNGVGLDRLATGYIKKITNESTIVV